MPNGMRRERGRSGGVAAASHLHYDSHNLSPDELDRMDGLSPGLKMAIQGRRRLKKCIWAQTVFQVLKACLIVWAYSNHERVSQATTAACMFALVAIVAGHNGLERQSLGWLKAYIVFMAMSATLAAYPLYRQGSKGSGWSIYKRIPDSQRFSTIFDAKYLEGMQDVGSVTAQVLGLMAAANLLKYFSAPRQDKSIHIRERRSTRDRS